MKNIIQKYTSLGTDFHRTDPTHLISLKNDIYKLDMPMVWFQSGNFVKKHEPKHFKHEEYNPEIH